MTQIIVSGSTIINAQPADSVIEVDANGIPTGLITRVDGSSFTIGDLHNYPGPIALHTGVTLPDDDPAARPYLRWDGSAAVTGPDYAAFVANRAGPVPPVVSMAQAQIALERAGLLGNVNTLIAGIGSETAIWWAKATLVERANPLVASLGGQLGLTSVQIDDLFRTAATI